MNTRALLLPRSAGERDRLNDRQADHQGGCVLGVPERGSIGGARERPIHDPLDLHMLATVSAEFT